MNNKRWYKLIFKQLQPIHIGAVSYGVINETRIFIPGWTMWGALTNAYNLKNGNSLSENQEIFEEISCFWPSFKEDGKGVLFPRYEKGEFYLGNYSEEKFRAMFIDTFVSTAVIPGNRMAKDESLHEIDVILPKAKADFVENKGKPKQLYWVGVINIEEDIENDFLKEGLLITVGGDSRYGLGKLQLTKVELKENNINNFEKANFAEVKGNSANAPLELLSEVIGYKGKNLVIKETHFYYNPSGEIFKKKLVKGILK